MKNHLLQRRAAIDIGTNSTRLLIADVTDDLYIAPLFYKEELTRLGAGFLPDGSLEPDAVQRVLAAVERFAQSAREMRVKEIRLFATSAVRDAVNGMKVRREIEKRCGAACRVLSGEEEARLTFLGAASGLDGAADAVLCDVGGGSTEIITALGGKVVSIISLQLGSSRETRRFFQSDPPTPEERLDLLRHVRSMLQNLPVVAIAFLLASGGTAYAAVSMAEKGRFVDPLALEGREVALEQLDELIESIAAKPLDERKKMDGLAPERSEVILAGMMIYGELLRHYRVPKMRVTLRDALFGAVVERVWKS